MTTLQDQIYEIVDKRFPIDEFIEEGEKNSKIKNTVGITCPTCKSDNIFVLIKQVRSADEEATKFFECLDCGYTWKL